MHANPLQAHHHTGDGGPLNAPVTSCQGCWSSAAASMCELCARARMCTAIVRHGAQPIDCPPPCMEAVTCSWGQGSECRGGGSTMQPRVVRGWFLVMHCAGSGALTRGYQLALAGMHASEEQCPEMQKLTRNAATDLYPLHSRLEEERPDGRVPVLAPAEIHQDDAACCMQGGHSTSGGA